MPFIDQLRHKSVKQRQKQRRDMSAVYICCLLYTSTHISAPSVFSSCRIQGKRSVLIAQHPYQLFLRFHLLTSHTFTHRNLLFISQTSHLCLHLMLHRHLSLWIHILHLLPHPHKSHHILSLIHISAELPAHPDPMFPYAQSFSALWFLLTCLLYTSRCV